MYEKQTWVTGETITAEKLNHMEDGISSGEILLVHVRRDLGQSSTYTVDVPYTDAVSTIQTKPVLYQIKTYTENSVTAIGYFFGELNYVDDVIVIKTDIDTKIYHTTNGIEEMNTPE